MDTHEVTGSFKEMAGKAEKGYGQLKDKVKQTTEEVSGRATGMNDEQVEGTAREFAGKAERAYGNLKAKVRQTADELAGNAGEYGQTSWDNTMALVQDNPGTALGLGLLAGAGIGALIAYLAKD